MVSYFSVTDKLSLRYTRYRVLNFFIFLGINDFLYRMSSIKVNNYINAIIFT